MKAIEFLRVSTQEQGNDDRAGLPRQREANARTIKKHNLNIVRTITLKDVSGTSVLHTSEIKELFSLIESDGISGVVVADMDRLFRPDNFKDFALLQNFKDTNTLIYLPDQVIDLNTQSGFLMGGFQSIIGGNELTQIKKRMMAAKEIKRKNGEHPSGLNTLPLGVSYDRKSRRFFYTKDIYKIKNLFEFFYYEGIQNYRELERRIGIKHRTIANLLRNELYIGYRTYKEKRSAHKCFKPNGRQADRKKVKRNPDEIIKVKVIDDPAIEESVFRNVQEIISRKNKEYHKKRASDGERFLYSGFLRCGVCGEIVYTTSGGRNHKRDYYYCRSKNYIYKKKNDMPECASSYIGKEGLEQTISSFVNEKLLEKNYLNKLITTALSSNKSKDFQTEVLQLSEALSKIKKQRSKLLDLYVEGVFTKDELNIKVGKLNDEIYKLKIDWEKIKRKQHF